MADVPRDKYIGIPINPRTGEPVELAEEEHYQRCPACGGWIDCRDLGMVLDHEGPLPHPGHDQVN